MHLMPLTNTDFAWLLDKAPAPPGAPTFPEGGLAEREVLQMFRGLVADLGGDAAWLMVSGGEAVGMISIKERDADGRWDIGYGVARMREGRGHATAAVAALKPLAKASGARGLTAETLPDSGASPQVLRRNGFVCIGQHEHPEDGLVDRWIVEWAA